MAEKHKLVLADFLLGIVAMLLLLLTALIVETNGKALAALLMVTWLPYIIGKGLRKIFIGEL